MFVPLRPKIRWTRLPVLTVAVAVACLATFWFQEANYRRLVEVAEQVCTADAAESIEYAQQHYVKAKQPCWSVLVHTHYANYTEDHLGYHLRIIRAAGDERRARVLADNFAEFEAARPADLTAGLWQWRGSWNPARMIAGVFAHASWDHVIGNLFFFVAFAIVVETIIGPILFLGLFIVMALGIGAVDNLAHLGTEALPTLGLSGVVMGMLALAAYFAPRVKIDFFYFFFIYIGVIGVPLWLLGVWYVGWNAYDQLTANDGPINYVAHLAGAAIGLSLGISLFRGKRHWVEEQLLPAEPGPNDEPTWLQTLNAAGTAPVVAGAFVWAGMIVIILVVKFAVSFAVQILMLAPVVAALYGLKTMKCAQRSDYSRFREALAVLEAGGERKARELFTALAERGYARAQYALSRLYSSGERGARDPQAAVRWLQAAAERGYGPAQYALGQRYWEGDGLPRDADAARDWHQKAFANGVLEAGMSVGHICEHHPDKQRRDPGGAADAYLGVAALAIRRNAVADLDAAVRALRGVRGNHPELPALQVHLALRLGRDGSVDA